VAVDPDYAENGWIYLAYSHALEAEAGQKRPPAMTRIVRGRLKDHAWVDQEVIYEAPHATYRTTRHHYGCRIVFDPDGYLYFGIGDRGAQDQAQDLGKPNGKMHRLHRDGRVPRDNPFVWRDGALASIYSYGHRNPQGLAVHPVTGRVWDTEHGPMGGDELNLITPGRNYGWPVVTYGLNYNGTVISELTRKEGMEVPNLYWKPSIAVCGLDFYRGDKFPKWKNRLLVGALKYEEVDLLDIEGDRVIHQETILKNAGRVRDVACGPDGLVYVVLNQPGMVLRLSPIREKL
jgi:glucose/arabinose dehydrogenase